MPGAQIAADGSQAVRAGRIVLVRHGRPAVKRTGLMSAEGFNAWWLDYTESALLPGQTPPAELVVFAGSATHLLSSTLPRATESAALLAGERPVAADPLFVEAGLPAPPIPILRVTPSLWWGIARFAWLLGYEGGLEGRRAAEERTLKAAEKLDRLAQTGDVLLCAHGWFNRMLGRRLREMGWKCERDGGDGYWAARHYRHAKTPR